MHELVMEFLKNPPTLSPRPDFTKLHALQKHMARALKQLVYPQSAIHRWSGLVLLPMCVCVCVGPPVEGGYLLTRYQPQDEFTPPNACDIILPQNSAHQPLSGEMLADGCPLANVYGTSTGLPVGILPGASLCDT